MSTFSTSTGSHSVWASTFTPGYIFLTSSMLSGLNLSCTMHVPCQRIIFLEVIFCRFFPISTSGTNMIVSEGDASTTLTAFADVQQESHSALTAADVLT